LLFQSNLLASGIGLNLYTSGSGIYSKGHLLSSYYNPTWEAKEEILISRVPIITPSSSAKQVPVATRELQKGKLNNNTAAVITTNTLLKQTLKDNPIHPKVTILTIDQQGNGVADVTFNELHCKASYTIGQV
jgi:hypothetical protein